MGCGLDHLGTEQAKGRGAALFVRLRAYLVDELFFGDPDAILGTDDDLFELGLDSLGVNRLVVFIERRLEARVPDAEVVADHFRTLRALVALVERCRQTA